jgi:predicted lipid-binding transport protein (Tim44 family)
MAASMKMRSMGPAVRFQFVDSGRAVTKSGLTGKVAVVLTALIGAIFFVGAFVVITALFVAAVLVALCVVAIRRAWRVLAPRSQEHHVDQGGFRPAAVIETTAKAIRNTAPKPRL